MSTNVHDVQGDDTTAATVLTDAVLLVTFYGPYQWEETLVDQLVSKLFLKQQDPDNWQGINKEVFLRRFKHPSTHDTTIVQIALNADDSSELANVEWISLRKHLETNLENKSQPNILDELVTENAFWGYTLTYQAVLEQAVDDEIYDNLVNNMLQLRSILPLYSKTNLSPLAAANVPGGRLWLLDIPNQGTGRRAGTVYVALGPRDKVTELFTQVLYGVRAALLMPDLIAHKAYFMMRQYRLGAPKSAYDQVHDALSILRFTSSQVLTDTAKQTEISLSELSTIYARISAIIPLLDELRISLAQQDSNYRLWQSRTQAGDVLEFHRSHIEMAFVELEQVTTRGRSALEEANMAVEIIQAVLDKNQESRQRWTDILLAALAVALAVPQLFDKTVVAALVNTIFQYQMTSSDNDLLLQTAIQTIITSLVAVIVILFVKLKQK